MEHTKSRCSEASSLLGGGREVKSVDVSLHSENGNGERCGDRVHDDDTENKMTRVRWLELGTQQTKHI